MEAKFSWIFIENTNLLNHMSTKKEQVKLMTSSIQYFYNKSQVT